MPIAQVFDPYTGAANGGGTGGSTGYTWRQILDFDDLTFSDPNGLVTDYSAASGLHSLTLATLGSSNVDFNFGSGSNFTGARWSFPLTYSDGSPVLVEHSFLFRTRVTSFAPGLTRNWNIAFAAVQNPTSTTLSTMDALGGTIGATGVGTPLIGTWRRNVVGTTSLASGTMATSVSQFGGAPGKIKVGCSGILHSASTGAPLQGLDANAWAAADGTQVYAVIAVGTLGTVTTTGGQVDFRLFYNVEMI